MGGVPRRAVVGRDAGAAVKDPAREARPKPTCGKEGPAGLFFLFSRAGPMNRFKNNR